MMKERRPPWWMRKKDDQESAELRSRTNHDHTIISVVSLSIRAILAQKLIPETLSGPESIGLCSPTEHGDAALGIYLYDISENREMQEQGMIDYDEFHQQYPPMYMNLHYMITAYFTGDICYRSEEEQRIIGKAMEVLHDNPVIDASTFLPIDVVKDSDIRIEYQNLSMEDKLKLWNQSGLPYRLSLFYKVSPVTLESRLWKNITRVKDIRYEYGEIR